MRKDGLYFFWFDHEPVGIYFYNGKAINMLFLGSEESCHYSDIPENLGPEIKEGDST